jgi:hypothetical protein
VNYEQQLTEMVERVAKNAVIRANALRDCGEPNIEIALNNLRRSQLESMEFGNSLAAKGRLWGGY